MTAPAARVVLVHGATGGPWTFGPWLPHLAGLDVRAVDLQEGLDIARATMADYETAVTEAIGSTRAVVVGYSMGGLVALIAGRRRRLAGLVLLEPSVPLEVGGGDADVVPRPGTYGGGSGRHRPESLWAQGERHRGISVPGVDCPLLVIAGRDFADTRGHAVVDRYGGELRAFPDVPHGLLADDPGVIDAATTWVRDALRPVA